MLFLCYTWWMENADDSLKIKCKTYVAEPRTGLSYIR